MAIGINAEAIQNLAGGEVYVSETDDTGSSYGTFDRLSFISGTEFSDETSDDTKSDEAGHTFSVEGTREVMLTVNCMQIDDDVMEWPVKTARGKYWGVLYKRTKNAIDGSHSWLFMPICRAVPSASRTSPGTEGPSITFRAQVNTAAVSGVDASSVDSNLNSMAVAQGEIYDYISSAT